MNELEKQMKFTSFACLLLGLFIIVSILTLPGCKSNMPAIDVSFWAGDSQKEGITRSQDHRTLECKDPAFENYTCLTYDDIKKIYDMMLECKQWPTLAASKKMNLNRFSKRNPEVIQHVLYQRRIPENMESSQR